MSRLLFDAVALKWHVAIGLEIAAGGVGALLAVTNPDGRIALAGTLLGFLCLATAYSLRLRAETQYDMAETMRRQSVFSEALGWPVSNRQISQARQRVGKRIRAQAREAPRDPDYFATEKSIGAQRFAEMTTESAFYTHQLYCLLRGWILKVLVVVGAIAFTLLMLPLFVSDGNDEILGRILYALLPVAFAVDLFGWWLRLGRTTNGLDAVLDSLEDLKQTHTGNVDQVLRVVAEYNSLVGNGFPVPNWLFLRWHDEIRSEWEEYLRNAQQRSSSAGAEAPSDNPSMSST